MTPDASCAPDPIPNGVTAEFPFTTTDELRDRWRALMGPLGFSERVLWTVFVVDDRLLKPALIQLPLEGPPDPDLAELFMRRMAELVAHTGVERVAMMISRPGFDGISPWDRGWVRLLTTGAEVAGVAIEPIFRANSVDLVEVRDSRAVRRSA